MGKSLERTLRESGGDGCPFPEEFVVPVNMKLIKIEPRQNGDHADDMRFRKHLIQTLGLTEALKILEKLKGK